MTPNPSIERTGTNRVEPTGTHTISPGKKTASDWSFPYVAEKSQSDHDFPRLKRNFQ